MPATQHPPRYDVFISYRRGAADALALLLQTQLEKHGIVAFLDRDLRRGVFDDMLLRRIAEASTFLVILTPHALDRCSDEEDWLRKEIVQAIGSKRNIIPLQVDSFQFTADLVKSLAPAIRELARYQSVVNSHDYFENTVERIVKIVEEDKAERKAEEEAQAEEEKRLADERAQAEKEKQKLEEDGQAKAIAQPGRSGAGNRARPASALPVALSGQVQLSITDHGRSSGDAIKLQVKKGEAEEPLVVERTQTEMKERERIDAERQAEETSQVTEPERLAAEHETQRTLEKPEVTTAKTRVVEKRNAQPPGLRKRFWVAGMVGVLMILVTGGLWVLSSLKSGGGKGKGNPQPVPIKPVATPAATLTPTPNPSRRAGTVTTDSKDGQEYVWIPPGSFQMGCSAGDNECYSDEKPAHSVTITKGFWLGETPVTQSAYQRAIGSNLRHFRGGQLPVETVTWKQAKVYCEAVGGRLPTEAEWEYAARAGSSAPRYGNLSAIAWHSGNSGGKTHEVGLKQANQWGLHDMLGNVGEWTEDRFDEKYYGKSPYADPKGPPSEPYPGVRVVRGGSWFDESRDLRSSYRSGFQPDYRRLGIGFRCAREVFP